MKCPFCSSDNFGEALDNCLVCREDMCMDCIQDHDPCIDSTITHKEQEHYNNQ